MKRRRLLRMAMVVCLVGGLGGCGTPEPAASEALSVPAPAAWTAVASESPGVALESWFDRLSEVGLPVLIDEALAHNHDLAAAAARVAQARALVRQQQAARFPQLGAGLGASDGGDLQGNSPPESYTLGLEASWEIDLWGRVSDLVAAQRAQWRATAADYEALRHSLAGQVARLYFDLAEAQAQFALAEETAANYRANEAIIERRFEAGLARALEVRLARTNTLSAEAAAAAARENGDTLARALEVLLGRYPANVLAAPGALPATVPLPAVGLPARLVARRPDLAAAEARYAAAVRTTGAARKLRYPRLALTGSLGTASQELGELLDDDLGVWNLVGNLTAPVFQGGRIAAQIEAAAAEEEAALESFAATLLNAYQEVETALASDRSLASRRALLEALVREADAAEDLAWEQYAKGLIEIITVLDTQRLAFTQRSQLLTLRNRQIQNRLSLVLALGGAGRPMAAAD